MADKDTRSSQTMYDKDDGIGRIADTYRKTQRVKHDNMSIYKHGLEKHKNEADNAVHKN